MIFAKHPFVKALAVSAAIHGITVGSLEALSGVWSRVPQDWIPTDATLADSAGPVHSPEDASLIWLPAEEAADPIERITVTPEPKKQAPTKIADPTDAPAQSSEAVATTRSDVGVEMIRQRVSASLQRVIREEWERELRSNPSADDATARHVFLKIDWAPENGRLDSIAWMPSRKLPGGLQERIESRLRNELFASSFTSGLTEEQKDALASLPRRIVLPVKFVRVQ